MPRGANELHNARGCGYFRGVMTRRLGLSPLCVTLLTILVALTPLAYATPPDPSWVSGFFDDDDNDNGVILITSGEAALDRFPLCCWTPVPVFGPAVALEGQGPASSRYPSKNLTMMGDGGILVTNDADVGARCWRLRDQGRLNKDVHAELGFNLRFNDIQAAIGRMLLRHLDAMNDHRRALAERYRTGLAGLPLALPVEGPGARRVYHLCVVRTPERDALARFLNQRGIATGIHYAVPSHKQPAVEHFDPPELPRTERIVGAILTLPMSAGHTESEVDEVVTAVREFFGAR